jgi:NitT/TauT family transport system permease protein
MSAGGERARDLLTYLALPGALLLVWHASVVGGLVSERLLPTPGEVGATLLDLVFARTGDAGHYSGDWPGHATASLLRVYAGFALAVALAVPIGLGIGLSRGFERLVDPTIQVLRNIPITGFLPIALLIFGFGGQAAVYLIALAAFFPTVVNTTYGVRQISPSLVRSARMLGASAPQRVTRVIVPAALPAIFTGLRLSMGVAWVLVVVAEFIGVRSGLGYLLFDAYQFVAPHVMLAAMASIGVLGFLSDRLILLVRSRVLAWNRLGTLRG